MGLQIPKLEKRSVPARTYAAIVLSNAAPVAGVLFLGWSLVFLLVYYLVEMVVIGALNVPKIYLAWRNQSEDETESSPWKLMASFVARWGVMCLFYTFCFAGCLVGIAAEGSLMYHDFLQPGDEPQSAFIAFSIGLGLVVVEQIITIFSDDSVRKRTAREQANQPAYRQTHPLFLGFGAVVVFAVSTSLAATVVAVGLLKMLMEIQRARGLSKSVMF